MNNLNDASMKEFIICGTEAFIKKTISFKPSIFEDNNYEEILIEIFVKKLPTIYHILDENNRIQIMEIYNKSMNTLLEEVEYYSKTKHSKLKNDSLQIGLIKLKILHLVQKVIMFDDIKQEDEAILYEYFDLLQIKETFLKEKVNFSVEEFIRKIILRIPMVFKIHGLIHQIITQLELGIQKEELAIILQNQQSMNEIKNTTDKSFINRKKIMKLTDTKLNCSEEFIKSLPLPQPLKSKHSSKIEGKKENNNQNSLFEEMLFEFDYNYNVFQYIPRRTTIMEQKLTTECPKKDENKQIILDNNEFFSKDIRISDANTDFKCPKRIFKYGINSRLALNMKFIPKIKIKKDTDKQKLATNYLKKHYKEYGLMGSEKSSFSSREVHCKDRTNIISEMNLCNNKSMISSQRTDVLAFCTPLDVNFFKTKRTLHF